MRPGQGHKTTGRSVCLQLNCRAMIAEGACVTTLHEPHGMIVWNDSTPCEIFILDHAINASCAPAHDGPERGNVHTYRSAFYGDCILRVFSLVLLSQERGLLIQVISEVSLGGLSGGHATLRQ